MFALHRQAGRQATRQRADRATQLEDLVSGRAHEVEILRERADRVLGDLFGPLELGESPPDLPLDLLLELLEALLELVPPQAPFERRESVVDGLAHQAGEQIVEVHDPEDAVLEVGAPRALGLHASELRDGLASHIAQRIVVTVK